MKGKIISEQSFKKIDIPQQISIKINRPNYNTPESHATSLFHNETPLPDLIKQQIKQVQTRIEKSQRILSQSRRQQKMPHHIIPSDTIPLRFNYQSTKTHNNTFDLYQLDQRDSQQSHQSEGSIQLPLHLQPSIDERNYMTLQKTEKKSNKKFFKSQYMSQKHQPSSKTERGLFLNDLTNSLEKRNFSKSIEKNRTPTNHMKATTNKSQFTTDKSRESIKNKKLSDDDRTKLQQFLITIDEEMSHRSKQKINREKSNVWIKRQQNTKVKIKLNNPSGVRTRQDSNYTSVRPRYHIQMPQEKVNVSHQAFKPKQEGIPRTDWQELREKLQKYQFVKKYLHESDLHQIYEYLKKNHINQQKWPLFVVDQAYKRMNNKC